MGGRRLTDQSQARRPRFARPEIKLASSQILIRPEHDFNRRPLAPAHGRPILKVWRYEHRHLGPAPWRGGRVPQDPQQVVDRHEVGIGLSGGRQRFALPSLPRERRSISRPPWVTGAPPETPLPLSAL
jgi:hypothetical protein